MLFTINATEDVDKFYKVKLCYMNKCMLQTKLADNFY